MKSNVFLIVAAFYTLFFYGCVKEVVITEAELPSSAKAFIVTHFAGTSIASVVKKEEAPNTSYEVVLKEGTSLNFDSIGECTEIDGTTTKLPDSVIPTKILEYVQTNYATDFIVSWEKRGMNQGIKLASKVELRFDKEDSFLQLED